MSKKGCLSAAFIKDCVQDFISPEVVGTENPMTAENGEGVRRQKNVGRAARATIKEIMAPRLRRGGRRRTCQLA